jgi:hypothetical protein
MSHRSRHTNIQDVKDYVETLKYFNITTFYFKDIPKAIKDMRFHNAACMLGLFKATGNVQMVNRNWIKEWTIKD